uniref:Cytochrome P450 n=1 Tax=Mycena chlorophos TaxID=658473 RepID=A0ABQ0M2R1_MYCCL|nr:cytochrome P450 [Mycena chlorophos]
MPAFSSENMSSLVEITFRKGLELRDTWATLVAENASSSTKIDVCHFLSRAAFDVIGLAGFDYSFNSINDETNELFLAYRKTFEVFISQTGPIRTLLSIYLPWVNKLFADETVRVVEQSHKVVRRVAGRLIQEKKQKIADGEKYGDPYDGKDLLTLLLKSNAAKDLPLEQRISDEDILNNINTFIFAGSDTSSMSMTWTLLLLARHPRIQDRLRAELLGVSSQFPASLSELSPEQMQSLYVAISALPFLHNVTRESLRLIPPLHSTLRVPTRTDEIPTSHPIPTRSGGDGDKYSFTIPKGTVVHVSFEAFNVDKSIWGDDAWDFKPDRWDTLPNAVYQHPWHFSNMFSFSAGPRACPGLRFSLIEIKIFYYILLTNFVFQEADKITPYNVVLTRPYISGRFRDGAQCPLLVSPFVRPS